MLKVYTRNIPMTYGLGNKEPLMKGNESESVLRVSDDAGVIPQNLRRQ
jgi:hypothetical protein